MRYGPETAEEVVPPADAESWAGGAPRLMVWMTPTPGFQAEADAVGAGTLDEPALAAGTLEPALTAGAPVVVVTATGGGGS